MLSKSFLKSSFVYTVSGALPMVAGLVLLPLYTNKLFVADFGILALLISITLLSQVIFNFSFDSYIGVRFNELSGDKVSQKKSISSIFFSLKFIGIPFIILSLLFLKLGGARLLDIESEHVNYIILSIVTGFFNSYFKTFTNLLIYQKRSGLYFISNLINFILTVGISVIGIELYPFSLVGPVYGRFFSGIAIFLLAFILILKENGVYYKRDVIKDWLHFCFPYLLFAVIFWLLTNFDKFIINYNISSEDVALYDLAIKCAILIEFIQNGFGAAIYPEVFEIYKKEGGNKSSAESNSFFSFFTVITLLSIVAFNILLPPLITLFVKNQAYYQVFSFLGIIAISYAIRPIHYMFFSTILYLKKTKLFIYSFGISAVFQLSLTYILTLSIGLKGAIISVVLVKPLQALLLYLFVKKHFSFNYNAFKLLYLPLAFLFMNLIAWIIGYGEGLIYNSIVAVITFLLIVFVYQNEIIFFIKKYTKKIYE